MNLLPLPSLCPSLITILRIKVALEIERLVHLFIYYISAPPKSDRDLGYNIRMLFTAHSYSFTHKEIHWGLFLSAAQSSCLLGNKSNQISILAN